VFIELVAKAAKWSNQQHLVISDDTLLMYIKMVWAWSCVFT